MLRKISISLFHRKHGLILRIRNYPLSYHQMLTLSSVPPNSACSNMLNQEQVKMRLKDYDSLLKQCIKKRVLKEGQGLHAHMIRTCDNPPEYLKTRLIVLYVKCEVLSDAVRVFDEMPERNVVSWTAMISGFSRSGLHSEALDLFVRMLRSGTSPNEFTFATVLTSCTGSLGLQNGRQIHSLLVKTPFEDHIYVGSSLLDMYAKAGKIHEARYIFEGLPEKDVVSCTAIISGYAQLGLDEEAVEVYRRLQREGLNSNYVTYASVVTALSGLAAFEHGRQVHNHVLRSELPLYVVLQNSLIDMYAKCGNITYARRIFDKMPERSVISWNAMIVGYSKNGMGKDAVDLYEIMRERSDIRPNSTTLLAVLSGCGHGGMENQGLEIFNKMVTGKDGDHIGIEHYGCIVDLLGRAGQVKRAFEFIQEMPIEPNAAIWGSLLGACRVHRNVDIGKIAGDQLLEIEPENAGNYVVLSNLYGSTGRWDEVRILREMMKEKSMAKEPGKSWIELGQTLHTFYASDKSHPMKEELSAKVRELSNRIKEVGYAPDLSCVLYDVDEEQKEKILLSHSEKLALAFGMISLSEGKPIRVMKNLRVCIDCHNFVKYVSLVYGREVLLRDKSRFHHIVSGTCSCGDYW